MARTSVIKCARRLGLEKLHQGPLQQLLPQEFPSSSLSRLVLFWCSFEVKHMVQQQFYSEFEVTIVIILYSV